MLNSVKTPIRAKPLVVAATETDAQRLENLATNFVGNIADIIVKLQ